MSVHTTDEHPVVSERVQLLAKGIYGEMEGLMKEYGQHSISSLMPMVVNVLESLDSALSDNQDHLTAVMELTDENQQLLSQYEKEKHRRRDLEEKAMQLEENSEQQISELRKETLQLNVENKFLMTKLKNHDEQIDRLGKRNEVMMKEHKDLHEKNRELIRNYLDQVELLKENAAARREEAMREDENDEQQQDQMEEQVLNQDDQPVGTITDDTSTSTRIHSTTPFAATLILKHTEKLVKSVSLNLLPVSMLLLQSGLITQQTYEIMATTPSPLSRTEKSAQLVNAIFTGLCVNPSRLSDYLDVLQPIAILGGVIEIIRAEYDAEVNKQSQKTSEVTANESILIGEEVDDEFCRIRLRFGRVLARVMSMLTKEMTLDEIKFQLSIAFNEHSDELEGIESLKDLSLFIRNQSNFTHFPILRALCEVFELDNGVKLLDSFTEERQNLYHRLLCQDFAKLAIEQHKQKSHGKIVFKARWAKEATLHEFDAMLEQTFHSAKQHIQLQTVISGCLAFICEAPRWMLGALKMIVNNKQSLLSSLKIAHVVIDGEMVMMDSESPVDTSSTKSPDKCVQDQFTQTEYDTLQDPVLLALRKKAAVDDEENDPELLRGRIKVKEVMEERLREEIHDLKRRTAILKEQLSGHQDSLAASSSKKSSEGESRKNVEQELETHKKISRAKTMEINTLRQQLEEQAISHAANIEDMLMENRDLHTKKEELTREVETLKDAVIDIETEKSKTENERDNICQRVTALDKETKRLRKELNEEKTKCSLIADEAGAKSERISRLEIAKVLRERNEYKEKYFSLLEQVRMNDELSMSKKKPKESKWSDYFTALFSTTRRRQFEQSLTESSLHKPILPPGLATTKSEEQDPVEFLGAGYANTKIIPTLRKAGRKEDELYMTSINWLMPSLAQTDTPVISPTGSRPPVCPNISTCRPMNFQEEGAKIFCASAVNPVQFLEECNKALLVPKEQQSPGSIGEHSMSMVWICTGTENLSKVSIMDAGAVGEMLETFPVSSDVVVCMAVVPTFDEHDPDVLSSLSNNTRRPQPPSVQSAFNERPSSKLATMWMGSETGVLYVHSAMSQWKKCIHADKLPAGIQAIVHSKGKTLLLLQNASVAVFRRFPDGEWDWDNYEMVALSQKRNIPVTAMAAVKYSVWCAIGNTVHVLHTHHLRVEATFSVHARRHAKVQQMLNIGEGVWISFKQDSVIRLFHATSFTHMQDLDISSQVHRVLVFGSEERSSRMPVIVSCLTAAHNSLWVGTENGVLLTFPFTTPAIVAEETGWEVIKEAEISGQVVPEPFDVRTEQALDISSIVDSSFTKSSVPISAEENVLAKKAEPAFIKSKQQQFNPFCNLDQVQLSIHCHVNAVTCLITIPGTVLSDSAYDPLGGVYIGPGEKSPSKPALFVMSCGGGHLDLRTADKVMQTIHAQEAGRAGFPTATSIISEKNYLMIWDITM